MIDYEVALDRIEFVSLIPPCALRPGFFMVQVTSHIQGMFNRTIRMLSKGVKPCYIFDGKPPQLKGGEVRCPKERQWGFT